MGSRRSAGQPPEKTEPGLRDARDVFERTVIAMCRERGLHRRLSPENIGDVVEAMVDEFAGTLDELESLVSREDWDEIHALVQRERAMAAARGRRMRARTRGRRGAPRRL